MPKARSFQGIALTAPGVNSGEIEGGFQVNGASGAENSFTVDGVVTNSLIDGRSRQDTVFEYLQEVQVKTSGIDAEYGGALGGVISAVTKSGGNQFSGEGHYYYIGNGLSAGPIERIQLSPVDNTTVFHVQDDKQKNNRNEFGGSIGGPIVKDRLFFFGSVSPRFVRRDQRLPVLERHRAGLAATEADADAGVRQGDLRVQPREGERQRADDPDAVDRHARRLSRHRHELHHQLGGAERAVPDPGFRGQPDQRQRRREHLPDARRPSSPCAAATSTTTTRTPASRR